MLRRQSLSPSSKIYGQMITIGTTFSGDASPLRIDSKYLAMKIFLMKILALEERVYPFCNEYHSETSGERNTTEECSTHALMA